MTQHQEFIRQRPLAQKDLERLYRAILESVATQAQIALVTAPDVDHGAAYKAYRKARQKWMKRMAKQFNIPPPIWGKTS